MNQAPSVGQITELLKAQGYISDASIATSLHLAMLLRKPLLIEGPAGVGKTEIAKVMSKALQTGLIRLQCYEGLDASQAIYEWNYQRQLLFLKMSEQSDLSLEQKEASIFSADYLLQRPLLQSIMAEEPQVLLIDEIDRADEEFESFFLELLSDWQISIPEMGTLKAKSIPYVIVTSNRIRELSEALRRRCLYLWIDYPTYEKELEIVLSKVPHINRQLAEQITGFMKEVRKMRLEKLPGVAETLDWAMALSSMHIDHLDRETVESTLGVVLKDWQDIREAQLSLNELFDKVGVKLKMG
ncbi:MAG: MoxR family ATPase [Bacteroidota bacterium]